MAFAKYSNINNKTFLTFTLKVFHADGTAWTNLDKASINGVGCNCFGGSASIINTGGFSGFFDTWGHKDNPVEHDPGDPPPPGTHEPGSQWWGVYYPYTVSVSAAGTGMGGTDSAVYYLWAYDYYGLGGVIPSFPTGAVAILDDTLEVSVKISATNLFVKGERTDDLVPSNRQLLDFTDQSGNLSWFCDENSVFKIEAITPVETLSSEGSPYATDTNITFNPYYLIPYISMNYFNAEDTGYGFIKDIVFSEYNVDLSGLNLYSPGTNPPDPIYHPNWGRTEDATKKRNIITNSGGITMTYKSGAESSREFTWTGRIDGPLHGKIISDSYRFEDSIEYSGTVFESDSIVKWELNGDTYESKIDPWTGDKEFFYQYKSWLFKHERGNLIPGYISVRVKADWRDDNLEDVDGENEDENDQQMPIRMHPLNISDFTSDPYWPMVIFTFDEFINLLIPEGQTTPPSLWIGTNCSVTNYNTFTVGYGQTGCYVSRNLASRFELRMARLNDHLNDPEKEHLIDWIIMHKANIPIAQTQDDPNWWSSLTGGFDAEDITDLSNRNYLYLDIDAPKDGTLTLQLKYDIWAHSSPYYTCFEHTFGPEGEHESVKIDTKILSWTFDVIEGNNLIQLDIQCSDSLEDILYENSIKHAKEWILNLPDNDTGLDETWTINSFYLCFDQENTQTLSYRYKRPHSWVGTNWFGFGIVVDGIDAGYMDYGYSAGTNTNEPKFLQSCQRRHCPESTLTDILDYAKTLDRLCSEMNWQEGLKANFNNIDESIYNKDSDDAKLAASLYWWDLEHQKERSDGTTQGAVAVGRINILGGIEQNIYTSVFIQGKIHGLVRNGNERLRSSADSIEVFYRHEEDEDWLALETVGTDSQGRFETSPIKEEHFQYKIGEDTDILTVINRSYTTHFTVAGKLYYDPHIICDGHGSLLMAVESEGEIYAKIKPIATGGAWKNIGKPFEEMENTPLYRPSICSLSDGRILVSAHDNVTGTHLSYSENYGYSWHILPTQNLGFGIFNGTLWTDGNYVYLSGDDNTNIVLRYAYITDLENFVNELTVTLGSGRSFCYVGADGKLWVGHDDGTNINYFYNDNIYDSFGFVATSELGIDLINGSGNLFEGEHALVGATDNGDNSNNIVWRSSTKESLELDYSEIIVSNVLWTTDTEPKSVCYSPYQIVVVGAGGSLKTYRMYNSKDGFVQIC